MVSKRLDFKSTYLYKLRWICILLVLIAFLGILNFFPGFVQDYYRLMFFHVLRIIFDPILDLLPFSAIWILTVGTIAALIKASSKLDIANPLWWLNSACKFIVFFYILWGFNYKAPELKDLLPVSPSTIELDENQLVGLITKMNDELAIGSSTAFSQSPTGTATREIREAVKSFLRSNQLSAPGNPKIVFAQGNVLRRIGISGIYLPYTFELYVDNSLLPAQHYFTIAHELGHAFGYTNEGEANFIACISLLESKNSDHQAVAKFEILQEALYRLNYLNEDLFDANYKILNSGIKQELELRKSEAEKYRNWLWTISSYSNDIFLKFQGQESGNQSYSGFLEYCISWNPSLTQQ